MNQTLSWLQPGCSGLGLGVQGGLGFGVGFGDGACKRPCG